MLEHTRPTAEETNLGKCLDGLDHKGEAGLQEALDRIYPASSLKRVPFGRHSHALVASQPMPTTPYRK